MSTPQLLRKGQGSHGADASVLASSPHRQLSRTKSRIALDRFASRPASIAATRAPTLSCRCVAISQSASQKAGSIETLVACPAIRTERLMILAPWAIALYDGAIRMFFKPLPGTPLAQRYAA